MKVIDDVILVVERLVAHEKRELERLGPPARGCEPSCRCADRLARDGGRWRLHELQRILEIAKVELQRTLEIVTREEQ